MIYTVTYTNESGQVLQTATFNAEEGPRQALNILLTTPSLQPPPGTVDIEVRAQR